MSKYETPEYQVVLQEEPFELRRYSDFLVVEYENEADPFSSNGFGTLFRYIGSDNAERQKISMTVPVLEEMSGEGKKMAFVVPKEHWEQVPRPNNPYLHIRAFDSGTFAAIRYGGLSNRSKEKEKLQLLEAWMVDKGFRQRSSAMLAFYDAPFVPPMFRRNEILVQVEEMHGE
ncbi:SOUL family heme-binding protein [Anaerotalea alkaliphila]|uniref:Heme-binding protein n=1 Tax=Anaerotalea alkaliphila TaxID=2662126 RepID=A0A7X5HVK3_9FIRM|nr:heme-binding protein [Anaerotalea alkaliphila]NDL67462.1 heme-binding protein [Anaerotalea alkaliphila]